MVCYTPNRAYFGKTKENGKANIVFRRSDSNRAQEIFLPCGYCIGCGLAYTRQWAIRCVHEASLHEENCFITLTFSEKHVPLDGSLDVKTFQDFIKRLRKHEKDKKIRYFHCGEYGEIYGRPHYHAILFGHDFMDKTEFTVRNNKKVWISDTLGKLWPYGMHEISDVNFASASYVAGYVTKKQKGVKPRDKADYYKGKKPEYVTMSRRPGIAKGWIDKYMPEVYPSDEILINGQNWKPPRFYDNQLDKQDPKALKLVKDCRESFNKKPVPMLVKGKTVYLQKSNSFVLKPKEVIAEAKLKIKQEKK